MSYIGRTPVRDIALLAHTCAVDKQCDFRLLAIKLILDHIDPFVLKKVSFNRNQSVGKLRELLEPVESSCYYPYLGGTVRTLDKRLNKGHAYTGGCACNNCCSCHYQKIGRLSPSMILSSLDFFLSTLLFSRARLAASSSLRICSSVFCTGAAKGLIFSSSCLK